MTFKILKHFVCEYGVLRQIFHLETAEEREDEKYFEEKEEREQDLYDWQWAPFGGIPVTLTFVKNNGNIYEFKEGNLTYDHVGCTFTYHGKTYRLNNV